jgi:hypothetical protein
VDVAVFEKAVTEQKAKQQAELDAMSAELHAAKKLVEETTFRLEETLAAAQEAAHDAANALREAVEAEATAAAEQTALALEEQRLALRTAASQALVRVTPQLSLRLLACSPPAGDQRESALNDALETERHHPR